MSAFLFLVSGYAFNFLQLKPILLRCVGIFRFIHFAQEHFQRAKPQPTIAVKFAVDDKRGPGFGVVGNAFHQIVVALKMTVDAPDFDFTRRGFLLLR